MRIFIALLFAAVAGIIFPCAASQPESIHIESLIAQSVGMERRFLSQGLFFEDKELEGYLNDILAKLATPEEKEQYMLRVRVLRSGAVNAFAAPHGVIYVCAGLLARVENEGQVAALLAHELAHVVNHHAAMNLLMMKESAREHAQAARGAALLLGDGVAGSMTGAALRAAVSGYNRGLERDADSLGIVRMAAAGYPHSEFRGLFVILRDYVAAERIKEPYFFSSHPKIVERLENYARIVENAGSLPALPKSDGVRPEDNIEKGYFCIKLRNVILYDAEINLAAGRFDLAGAQLDRLLSVDGGDIVTLVMRGDMERKMSPRSASPAEWYGKALRQYPGHAGALRGMGFMYHSIGDKEKARKYLSEYCELAADAADIKMAREALRRCGE